MIIVITGTIASGKGKVAEIIKEKGFEHHSFSREIRAIARERNIEINRNNLSELGKQLRKESSEESILTKKVLEKIQPNKKYVVDGLRDLDELNSLKKYSQETNTELVLIAITAPQEIRFQRLKSRKRHGDPETFEEFKQIDDAEFEKGGGQEVGLVIEQADYIVDNSGSLDELKENIKRILDKL